MERIKANDPAALRQMGVKGCYHEGDYDTAFEYLTKAAEFGDIDAHFQLGALYMNGRGVEKDEEKAVYYYEKSAIGGHPYARQNLACHEWDNGNIERSAKRCQPWTRKGNEIAMEILFSRNHNQRGPRRYSSYTSGFY
jgi:TPR repeat protein